MTTLTISSLKCYKVSLPLKTAVSKERPLRNTLSRLLKEDKLT